jgi:hypothetical protein
MNSACAIAFILTFRKFKFEITDTIEAGICKACMDK